MHVYFTTVVRGSPLDSSGELVKINWEGKVLVNRVPVAPSKPVLNDPNPRGNSRGGRGIILRDGNLYVASYHTLHVYDPDLTHQADISHPLFVGLHELAQDEDFIWVTSTAIDAVIGVDTSGTMNESLWPRESEFFQRHSKVIPLKIDKNADNRNLFLDPVHMRNKSHLHLNAVAIFDHQLYALFNRFGIVYNLTEDKILFESPQIVGCHNLLFKDEHIFINDSLGRNLVICNQDGTLHKTVNLLKFPEVYNIFKKFKDVKVELFTKIKRINLARDIIEAAANKFKDLGIFRRNVNIARPIFVRGLSPLEGDRVLIGLSPATIIELDYRREEILDYYQYSDDIDVCVHGLAAVE